MRIAYTCDECCTARIGVDELAAGSSHSAPVYRRRFGNSRSRAANGFGEAAYGFSFRDGLTSGPPVDAGPLQPLLVGYTCRA